MRLQLLVLLAVCAISNSTYSQYFQQDVAYNIRVELDDVNHVLRGDEEVVYTNNSPDTLDFVYFHLWPNAYKNKSTALAKQLIRMGETTMYFAEESELGYIDSLSFALNGRLCLWEYDPDNIDICKIYFETPLEPGESVTISTPFKVKLPSGKISRLGHIGESYQITQWYPKPAVYDTAGWHAMPYLTQGEFYSEFGSFDVFITLPKNYMVGATGDLQTVSEFEFLQERLDATKKWIKKRESNGDWEDHRSLEFPESSDTLKTLHFHQERVHDFGWFADKRYRVLKGKVELPHSLDSVDVWTMFTDRHASLWKNSIEYMHDAIYYYSLWNGDYPYKHATAVDGTISAGGGMEYPNVTVIGASGNDLGLETVIMHEVGHNWFYGILGSNERRYPWLDEGINSYNEQRYLSTKYPDGKIFSKQGDSRLLSLSGLDIYNIEDQHFLTYLLQSRSNRDQPMDIPSDEYSLLNYGCIVYSKSAVTLNYLRHYLGDSTMDAGMQQYFEKNKFKHPYPKSLENAIEGTAKENLDWFFHDIVSTKKKLDFGVKRVKSQSNQYQVRLVNKGGIKAPVHVALMQDENSVDQKWIPGFDRDTIISLSGIGTHVKIDPNHIIPENNRDNNTSRTKGILKRVEPLKLKLIGGVENPELNQMFMLPVFGVNVPNGFMPGALFYNHLIPARKFSYFLAPLYGLKSNSALGSGLLSYSIQPIDAAIENIELRLAGKRYAEYWSLSEPAFYNRLNPEIRFYIRPNKYQGIISQKFSLGSVFIWNQSPVLNNSEVITTTTSRFFGRGGYDLSIKHPVYQTNFAVNAEYFNDYVRTSLEVNETISFDKYLRLSARFFAGAFLSNNSNNGIYNWRLDGQSSGTDYAYDGEFFDRSGVDDFLSRQFLENHGAFKVPTAVGQSSRWLTALNLKAKIGKTPLGLFADIGFSHTETFLYDAGIYAAIIPDIVEVYLPLVYSSSIGQNITANGLVWYDLIRFQIGLEKLAVIERIKRLDISL